MHTGKGEGKMTKLHELAELGQAIWLDYLRRSFIEHGDVGEVVANGLREVAALQNGGKERTWTGRA